MATVPVLRQQNWGDDLRLPTFTNPVTELGSLLGTLETIRKPSVPFQSKHLTALKRNMWFVLRRPADRSRSGLLCITAGRCVYVSGQASPTPKVALLRLRIDPQFYDEAAGGMTVFSATLSAGSRKLWIEDVLTWKGRNVWAEEGFAARWLLATQWLEHYCIQDPRLIGGLDVEIAPWGSLDSVTPDGVWELQGDQMAQRRLLWIANHGEAHASPIRPVVAATVVMVPAAKPAGPLTAVATRDTSGPDQWALATVDGVSLGRGLIRKLRVSSDLREIKGSSVRVHVSWAATFNKWEILDRSEETASHSSFFETAK
jgi:hypothetical protein